MVLLRKQTLVSTLFLWTVLLGPILADVPQCYCGRGIYGAPQIEECFPLLESFANHQDYSQSVFDEEQLRIDDKGSWPGVLDIVGRLHINNVVQVPRYYTRSM